MPFLLPCNIIILEGDSMLIIDGKVDNRHVVDIVYGATYTDAVVITNTGYERIMYMTDDIKTLNNECEIDATSEEKEAYRRYMNHFQVGDKIRIISGCKMVDSIKTVESVYKIEVCPGKMVDYLGFDDGSRCQACHCQII